MVINDIPQTNGKTIAKAFLARDFLGAEFSLGIFRDDEIANKIRQYPRQPAWKRCDHETDAKPERTDPEESSQTTANPGENPVRFRSTQ